MWQHFRLLPFVAGLGLGLLLFFFYTPQPVAVYQYPHPENTGKRVYKDTNGICYMYKAKEVDCDANEGTLRAYPLQA